MDSLLTFYRKYFGDKTLSFVDLVPQGGRRKHIGLDELEIKFEPDGKTPIEPDPYVHPCWCMPDLVYVDDFRGNQVWDHKRIQ